MRFKRKNLFINEFLGVRPFGSPCLHYLLVPDIVRGLAVAIPDHGLGLRETRVGKSLISDPYLAENFRSDLDGVGIGIDDYFLPAYK
jgi:hypothetical protein